MATLSIRNQVNNDMSWGQNASDYLIDTPDAVALLVTQRLNLWLADFFLDQTAGTPYSTEVLGKFTENTVVPAVTFEVLTTLADDGTALVTAIYDIVYLNDHETRKVNMSFTIDTIFGTTKVQVGL